MDWVPGAAVGFRRPGLGAEAEVEVEGSGRLLRGGRTSVMEVKEVEEEEEEEERGSAVVGMGGAEVGFRVANTRSRGWGLGVRVDSGGVG